MDLNFARNVIADVTDEGLNTSLLQSKVVEFAPGNDSFTMLCEINCTNLKAGNRIFSKRSGGLGFELVVPRCWPPNHVISVYLDGKHFNIGTTRIAANEWYHIAVTVDKAQNKKSTECRVYLNGKYDGQKVFPSNNNWSIGSYLRIPANIGDWVGHEGHTFSGEIRNFQIFYEPLCSEGEIHGMAYVKGYLESLQDAASMVKMYIDARVDRSCDIPEPLINEIAGYCIGSPLK